ncbi:AAA family ATPase [Streptomyces sp. DH1]|uniref:AAA family ATPase n=1 Tax=Streptomyces sp. DH1 TaxID=2857012 RepID=UPI001E4C3243|nr:AAA family ATPase [Streptomyces sp. DH1]
MDDNQKFMSLVAEPDDVLCIGFRSDEYAMEQKQALAKTVATSKDNAEKAQTLNVYFTPVPQARRTDTQWQCRANSISQPGQAAFADCDKGLTAEQMRFVVEVLNGTLVRSGSLTADGRPKYHVYAWLNEKVDPRHIQLLSMGMAKRLDGDHKYDPAAFLRVPGTLNHKTSPPRPVEIERLSQHKHAPEGLARLLGMKLPPVEELGSLREGKAATYPEVLEFINSYSDVHDERSEKRIKWYLKFFAEKVMDGDSRHNSALAVTTIALGDAASGHVNAEKATEAILKTFKHSCQAEKGRPVEDEYEAIVAWSLAKVRADQKEAVEKAEERVESMRSRMLNTKQLRRRPNPRFLIEGVLDHNTLGRSVGAPGAGKTFGALSMGMHVAQGTDWYGHRVMKGPVVYLVAEGVDGFKKRVWAWEETFGDIPEDQILFLPEPVQVMEDPWQDFITVAAEIEPVMIILDTQARITLGIEENANSDMGKVVQRLDSLRNATRAHVHLVHHTGHEQKRGRGASAVLGAVDTELIYTKEKGEGDGWIFRLENQKQKDSAEAGDMFFMPEVVELGKDEDDRMMSSLVFHSTAGRPVASSDRKAAKEHKANRVQAAILTFLENNPRCSLRAVRAYARKEAGCGQDTFDLEMASLERDGYIKNEGTKTNHKWVRTNKAEKHTISREQS